MADVSGQQKSKSTLRNNEIIENARIYTQGESFVDCVFANIDFVDPELENRCSFVGCHFRSCRGRVSAEVISNCFLYDTQLEVRSGTVVASNHMVASSVDTISPLPFSFVKMWP